MRFDEAFFKSNFQPLRRLFGAKEIETKLQKSKVVLDSLFTGVDCPHAAYQYLTAACRRRRLDTRKFAKYFEGRGVPFFRRNLF